MPVDSSTKTLLIVDDSKVSRMLIRTHILTQRPEWIISEAACGEDAIALVANDLPDYCTMDINMPGISGTEAAEQILANHPSIKIVIFSANIQETHQERARSLGTILVAKPVTEKSIALALDYFDNAQ
ncbi:MAG: response regulator [Methylobacter sp.]|uniref:Response regulator n=1 Tax=Candidatus Methylobacter titanis TaxID=3053457 RepID=A0AA43Q844_9GAMM|nr:response regulator [Candidatus Methylobacter titanis]MDI1293994.1 response regulator [Candidatus Methylobacter titanis]